MFAEYIRLIVSGLGLPSEYDYWLAEYSPIIPQKSIITNPYRHILLLLLISSYYNVPMLLTPGLWSGNPRLTQPILILLSPNIAARAPC